MRLYLAIVLLVPATSTAMEGQWRPGQIPELAPELQEMGLAIPPSQLAEVGADPLGAIVDLDYCSAAFVSPEGLIATAYHCVTDGLQFASRADEDLFEHGFHAATRDQERWAGPDQTVRVTTAVEDVTEKVLSGTKRLEGAERLDRIDQNEKGLVRRCESGPMVHCEVATYGDGTAYELVTQTELQDVRLVYAPPRSVGYFGGDEDNWRWPRHSGDFAFLRAYVSEDGESTRHHPANVPYEPPHHLAVDAGGVAPGDYVMVAGYPNISYRWRAAAELDHFQEEGYPLRIEVRRDMVDILERWMERDPELAARLGPRRLNLSNDLVYYRGTLAQFERVDAARQRWRLEDDLARWIAADERRAEEWSGLFDAIHRLQAEASATSERDYVMGQMTSQVDMLHAATTLYELARESQKPDRQREKGFQNRDRPAIADELDQMDARYDWRVDRDLLRYFLKRAMTLPEGLQVAELANWLDRREGESLDEAIERRTDELYAHTELADADERRDLMGTSPWYLEHSDNPWFELAAALYPWLERTEAEERAREAEWREVMPRYISALQAFIPENRPRYLASRDEVRPGVFYPDANRTLRITAGKVDGYFPRDGLIAAPHTTLTGLRHRAGDPPYDAPREVLAAIAEDGHGPYAHPDLDGVPVNYLTTLDTARGSSGSATLDAEGEFVGVIFDGNYEAIASDWFFDEQMTRSIHTDVRYILWYLDRVAGATALLEELGQEPHFVDADSVGDAEE